MQKLLIALAACATFGLAHAADPAPAAPAAPAPEKTEKAPTKQQNKMAECNKEAGEKKGDERKNFMSDCLKNKKKAQQDKMTSCNKEAGEKALKGAERKTFMSECLKKEA